MSLIFHKYLPVLLLFTITAILVFNTVSHLRVFSQDYEPVYMQRLFDYSQWRDPMSNRPINDETLYQIAGYHIVTTGELFEVNPEVPPLGKYLYGFSIVLFKNAYYASFILFLAAVITFYLFTKLFIKSLTWRLAAVLLFISDPLLSSQAYQTMLDIPQLVFLLVHMYAILHLSSTDSKKNLPLIILAGLSLGAFASIKVAFFTILIVAADLLYLYFQRKHLLFIPITLLSGLVYVVSYAPYFLLGHTFIEFLQAQKWILHFYLDSKAHSLFGMAFVSLFTGFIKGWDGRGWDRVREWTVLWPVFGISYIYILNDRIKQWKNSKDISSILYILIMIAFLFMGYLLVPFFARYFTISLPLLIILFILSVQRILHKFRKIIV